MAKNLRRYYQAWKLRREGRTLKEVGNEMKISIERVRILSNYVQFSLRKKNKDYIGLKKIMRES